MTFTIDKTRLAEAMQRVNLSNDFILARFGKAFEISLGNCEVKDEVSLCQLAMVLGVSEDYLVDTDGRRAARKRFANANSGIADELAKVSTRLRSKDDKVALLNDIAALIGLEVVEVKAVTLASLRNDRSDCPSIPDEWKEQKVVVS